MTEGPGVSTSPPAVVVDASTAVSLLGGDAGLLELWRAWTEAGSMILAPGLLTTEVANALLRSVGLDALETSNRVRQLLAIGLEPVDRGLPGLLGAVELADRHQLSVYDALYLDLALDVDGDLATLDRELASAAAAEGVQVIA